EYANHWEVYTDVSKLSSDVFFFGLAKGEETVIEIGEGKEITIKYIDMTEPNEEGFRFLTFEINGVMREIKVLDKHLEVKSDGKLKADKNNPFHLGSSIPGTVSKVLVKEGDEVKKNQPLLTVEAMKMETSVVAKEDGVIDKIYVKEGDKVNQGDLLVSFVQ
ncbi:MAG: biotin/lipoyl-binding protein, partial [Anaerotignum sp.]|nr:biotin/lipoyl-binding protein [Anaerotignum sp.]